MVGLIQNVGESLGFGFSQCYSDGFKGFLRMVTLLILSCVPIANFIPMGIFLKVFKGEKPDFNDADESLLRGFLFFVVSLIYMLPTILFCIFVGINLIPAIIGLIIALIILIISSFILIPAEINFARNGFAAAFNFSEIFRMIAKAGIVKYILSYIIFIIVMVIVAVILSLPAMISSLAGTILPSVDSLMGAIGAIVTVILALLVTIPLTLFEYRYWANRFEA